MEERTLRPVIHRLRLPDQEPNGQAVPLLLRRLAHEPGLVVLDSAGGSPRNWSLIGFDPFLSFDEQVIAPSTLDELEHLLSQVRLAPEVASALDMGPFAGGFLGALSYELGVRGEALELPEPAWPQPRIVGGLYRDWVWLEHVEDAPPRVWLVISEDSMDGELAADHAAQRARTLIERLERPVDAEEAVGPRILEGTSEAPGDRTVSREVHCARVASVRDSIGRGEVYQANVSHRMISSAPLDPLELYLRLRETNPAPYMGFLRFRSGEDAGALLSSSPELLLELGVGASGQRIARTRPIKGTVSRGATPEEDALLRDSLLRSEKDLAELAMIVDLERNDLGRVAEPGGVTVGAFPELETYAAVHHLVADVRARVSGSVTAIDVVASVFPGGSITGAPKLRSMEVIAELEQEGRGFFTGSMGFIDLRGRVALSILIRTMVHRVQSERAEVSFHVGGGITWNSDPRHEDDETLWKAAGLLRALTSQVTSTVDSQVREAHV